MPQNDLDVAQLATYRSTVEAPVDFADFWDSTVEAARERFRRPSVAVAGGGITLVETFDVQFSGFDGEPVRAWLHRPANQIGEVPAVVRYVGYGGGRGLPHQVPAVVLAGYACLTVDNRGQGSNGGYVGETPDGSFAPSQAGVLTRNILDRDSYYYRRLFTDAVLAVDAARSLPGVDPARIAVAGVSQGGGIAIAVAALAGNVNAVMPDVPFLSDIPRATVRAARGPYTEIARYLGTHRSAVGEVFGTMAYFDASVFAAYATAPALFSVALMDEICPPSTVYAAFNAYAGPKRMEVYPYNDHEGGQFHQEAVQLAWLRNTMPPEPA